jgi:hypothetical protein
MSCYSVVGDIVKGKADREQLIEEINSSKQKLTKSMADSIKLVFFDRKEILHFRC